MKKILIHGSGHKAASWNDTISHMENNDDILCPNLVSILEGKEASYVNLYSSFIEYCGKIDGPVHLCGISLGGILAELRLGLPGENENVDFDRHAI